MATFDVTVYETQNLASQVDGQAKERAKTYIEGAFSYTSHSVNVTVSSTIPNAPQERVPQSFSASDPCYPQSTLSYEDLGLWWKDYVQCVLVDDVMDCDLLLTGYDGGNGVCWNDRYAVAEGGPNIAELPSSFELYDCSRPFDDMQTALHELGHALLSGSFDEHNVGDTYEHGSDVARTPMTWNGSSNACGASVTDHTGCDEMRFSSCTESKM